MSSASDTTRQSLGSAIQQVLKPFKPVVQSSRPIAAQKAAVLARVLQEKAVALQTPQEKRQQSELERMVQSACDKATLIQLTDQAFRSSDPHRAVDQLTHILDIQGVPRFFSPIDRTLLKGFQSFGSYLPGVAVPLVKEKMREETANVILPAEHELLAKHLEARRQSGVRMNVNYLGEALLGEGDAERRLQSYLSALQKPEIEVISVKISTIYSQISSIGIDHTLAILCDRLELLYRAAAKSKFTRASGIAVPKLVYLDMEEYRDLHVTSEAFMQTLDRKGLEQVTAGVALQAYLPDSFRVQKKINEWARDRVDRGGAPVTVRLVKGANMEMERVEASLTGWPQAPYLTKPEVDANYKRMLNEAFRPENIKAVRVGVATHNLFDLAYGLVLASELRTQDGSEDGAQFEMLEGMANHQRRALFELTQNVLLYAPATKRTDFLHAIGYLIRRLDENTGSDNFLRHAFKITVDSSEWPRLEEDFLSAFDCIETLSNTPRRKQDRTLATNEVEPQSGSWQKLSGEVDTDFSLPRNIAWAKSIVTAWEPRHGRAAVEVPLVVAGDEQYDDRTVSDSTDPSRPDLTIARFREGTEEDVQRAVACARDDAEGWRRTSAADRSQTLNIVAQEIRQARAELMGAALADGGKTLLESDPEVSEAVDFVEFYAKTAEYFESLGSLNATPKGVVVVVSPWNFPIAIPCGGVAAALAAGNSVILKPASDTALVAYELCKCFWRGGIPQRTLQFLPGPGSTVGSSLVSHSDVDTVILTGGTETAFNMLHSKPSLNLLAETGGKNATIVTALSDREQAIKHVLHSAFSHSGQKCSATSLLILENEVYDDPKFRATLVDAAESITVGSAWDLHNRMGPLIRPPSGELETALKELEPGESWAVMPRQIDSNPHLYSPGVKWDVQPESLTHLTEFFGPVLGVMKARNLDHALSLIHRTGYGLTSGLESLDDREQQHWRERVQAGNLYINRVTTGAVVLRQPFGGMGKSAFGPGIKAGGPNYVAQLMEFESKRSPTEHHESPSSTDPYLTELRDQLSELHSASGGLPKDDLAAVVHAIDSYNHWVKHEIRGEHDHARLLGQDNFRRYLPVRELRTRVHPEDSLFEIYARICAAKAVGCRVTVSLPLQLKSLALKALETLTESWAAAIEFVEETDDDLAAVIRGGQTDRVRYARPERVPNVVLDAVRDTGLFVARAPVLAEGRVELLWYVREQSISADYHRYGNLGARSEEERAPGT